MKPSSSLKYYSCYCSDYSTPLQNRPGLTWTGRKQKLQAMFCFIPSRTSHKRGTSGHCKVRDRLQSLKIAKAGFVFQRIKGSGDSTSISFAGLARTSLRRDIYTTASPGRNIDVKTYIYSISRSRISVETGLVIPAKFSSEISEICASLLSPSWRL